jgi:hypothetical protein
MRTVAIVGQQQSLVPDNRAVVFTHDRKAEEWLSTGHDLSVTFERLIHDRRRQGFVKKLADASFRVHTFELRAALDDMKA